MLKILVVAALVAAGMVAVKDGRLLRDAGLKASCAAVATPVGRHGFWQRCTAGKLDGRPDLSRQGCKSVALRSNLEWWSCPAAIGSSRGT